MILEKQTQAKVLSSGQDNQSIGMSLDLDSAQVLMQMLSKNLYSDSIGSAVRECAKCTRQPQKSWSDKTNNSILSKKR